MQVGKLNDAYDRILNCRVVKPPYEITWSYTDEFFLDKRFWLENVFTNVTHDMEFKDYIDVSWTRYYLYTQPVAWELRDYIWVRDPAYPAWDIIKPITSGKKSSWCMRLVRGRWATWPKIGNVNYTVLNPTTSTTPKPFPYIPWYTGGYVAFEYNGDVEIKAGNYITFTTWVLTWSTVRVELVEWTFTAPTWGWSVWQTVYVIGTNSRWSLPFIPWQSTWEQFEVREHSGYTVLMWHATWVTMYSLDWSNEITGIDLFTSTEPIEDIQKFNAVIFALTESKLYYSTSTLSMNTNFYPTDYFDIDNGISLFVIGKAMLVFADTNKLVQALESQTTVNNQTTTTIRYVAYDCNYAAKPFSKHSYIFDDQTIHILQANRQLVECNVQQFDSNTFDLITKNVMEWTRGLFVEYLENGWVVSAKMTDRFMNYVMRYDWEKTRVFQYDKQMKHWIINEYECFINKFWDEILWTWFVAKENWFVDFWNKQYSQSVLFSVNPWPRMAFIHFIRTLFWVLPNGPQWEEYPIDLQIRTEYELWGKIKSLQKTLSHYEFDQRLSDTITADELVWYDVVPAESESYEWTFVSLQSNQFLTWRNIRVEFVWNNRFQIWHSTVYYDESKPTINELSNNN